MLPPGDPDQDPRFYFAVHLPLISPRCPTNTRKLPQSPPSISKLIQKFAHCLQAAHPGNWHTTHT